MAILSRLAISLLPVFMLLMLAVPAQALDAMRLDSRFSVTHLSPLITELEPTPLFAVRNGDDSRLVLLITRARLPVLLRAFMPDAPPPPGLRLFASDDTEFATAPDRPGHLTFFAPPASVMTYQLFGDDAAPGLYLWTPAYFAELEARRDTMRLFLFSLLSVMLLAGLFVGLYRRSRRALYACVMASSMLFLLASLWLENLTLGCLSGDHAGRKPDFADKGVCDRRLDADWAGAFESWWCAVLCIAITGRGLSYPAIFALA